MAIITESYTVEFITRLFSLTEESSIKVFGPIVQLLPIIDLPLICVLDSITTSIPIRASSLIVVDDGFIKVINDLRELESII